MGIEKKTFASELCDSYLLNGDPPHGRKEKKYESKYDDVKVKSLKRLSTLVCIISYVEEEKIKKSNQNS